MILSPGNCNKPGEFIKLYQQLLNGRRLSRILEIGVQRGDSIRMWASAFPEAEVIGLDLENKMGLIPSNVKIIVGNQNDTRLLQSFGSLDFIVDDGSHMTRDQQNSFETLFPYLNSGGIYAIEDLEINRENEFKNTPLSTREYFMEKLSLVEKQTALIPKFMDEGIKSITFADNILIVEKL